MIKKENTDTENFAFLNLLKALGGLSPVNGGATERNSPSAAPFQRSAVQSGAKPFDDFRPGAPPFGGGKIFTPQTSAPYGGAGGFGAGSTNGAGGFGGASQTGGAGGDSPLSSLFSALSGGDLSKLLNLGGAPPSAADKPQNGATGKSPLDGLASLFKTKQDEPKNNESGNGEPLYSPAFETNVMSGVLSRHEQIANRIKSKKQF